MNTKTEEFYKQSLAVSFPKQLGRATGYQIAEALDSLSCVKVVCAHVLQEYAKDYCEGGEIPGHWQRRIDSIPTGADSIAKIIRTLNTWKKWCPKAPDVNAIQNFLYHSTN